MSIPLADSRIGLACLILVVGVVGACGSRTPLNFDSDVCQEPGAVEACTADCGLGTWTCGADGLWGPCVATVTQRTCSNDCGQGVETCTLGNWSTCEVPVATRECSTLCGVGHEICTDGKWQACDAPLPKAPTLHATVRDFNDTHPDFERPMGSFDDRGIVEPALGPDDKPVYTGNPTTPTTSGKSYFDMWFNDTPGWNETTTYPIPLTPSPSAPNTLVYDNNAFFPIDNVLLGNQGRTHNFHFTVEIAVNFRYSGGETFRFTGDDDIWVFINRHLAIDLGGLHSAESARVDLDAESMDLGIAKGGTYLLKVFFAERHTSASTFHVETTVADWDACN